MNNYYEAIIMFTIDNNEEVLNKLVNLLKERNYIPINQSSYAVKFLNNTVTDFGNKLKEFSGLVFAPMEYQLSTAEA